MILAPSLSRHHRPQRDGLLIHLTRVFAFVVLLGSVCLTSARATEVVFVAPSTEPPYGTVIDAFNEASEALCNEAPARCRNPGPATRVMAPDAAGLDKLDPDDSLLITLGSEAAHAVADLDWRGKTLYSLIPSRTYFDLLDCCIGKNDRQTALFLDQPAERVLGLAAELLPDVKRMALLTSPASESLEPLFRSNVQELGLSLEIAKAPSADEVGPALKTLLDDAQVLIAVPDHILYNSETIYGVLLSTYRKRVPVIGFSDPLVRAGALAAVYTSPQDIGRELATIAFSLSLKSGRPLPPAGYPKLFNVSTNQQVGRSLGIELPSSQALKQALEGRP